MEIIPVIDVRHGQAVRAVAGDRANYKPLETPLAPGTSDPVAVARGYLALYPFKTLYVADLDGIEGRGANTALGPALRAACPGVTLWIDNGSASREGVGSLVKCGAVRAVVGSETGVTAALFRPLVQGSRGRVVLSLDYAGDTFQGSRDMLGDLDAWPANMIVMTLARVGAGRGPDLERVRQSVAAAGPLRRVYAAGGVRDREDVDALCETGAAGVLIATALHNGSIGARELEEIGRFMRLPSP